jgi:hypothetical protein
MSPESLTPAEALLLVLLLAELPELVAAAVPRADVVAVGLETVLIS